MRRRNVVAAVLSLACVATAGLAFNSVDASAAAAQSFEMNTGASIRTDAPAGIRFQTKILKTEYAELAAKGATYGTLVMPKTLLGTDELTATVDANGNVTAAANVLVVAASDVNTTTVDDTETEGVDESLYNYYYAVIVGEKEGDAFTGLPEEYYDVELVARSYVVYDGDSGKVLEYATNTASRSISDVASAVIVEGSDKYTETEYAYFHEITDYVAAKNAKNVVVNAAEANDCEVEIAETVAGVYANGVAVEAANWAWADGTLTFTSDYISTLGGNATLKVLADGAVYSLNFVVYNGVGETVALNKSVDVDFSEDVTTYALDLGADFDVDAVIGAELTLVKNGIPYITVDEKTELAVAGVEGTALQVRKDVAKAVPAGIYTANVQAVADGKLNTYTFELHLITKIVRTAAEFNLLSIQSNSDDNIYTNVERTQGYFVLGANIDYAGYTFKTINQGVGKFSGIFDGRGYNIDHFTTYTTDAQSGLFWSLYGGIVRNVSFTNAVKGKGQGGLIAYDIGGLYKNEADYGVNNTRPVGWYAELTNIFVSGSFVEDKSGVSLLFNFVDGAGHRVPGYSIKIDNIVVEVTGTAPSTTSVLQGATQQYTSVKMSVFDNVYVFGSTRLGRETATDTTYGLYNTWINAGVTQDVYAYADGILTDEIGAKIAEKGSIWNYEDGKLTMENDGESVVLMQKD